MYTTMKRLKRDLALGTVPRRVLFSTPHVVAFEPGRDVEEYRLDVAVRPSISSPWQYAACEGKVPTGELLALARFLKGLIRVGSPYWSNFHDQDGDYHLTRRMFALKLGAKVNPWSDFEDYSVVWR